MTRVVVFAYHNIGVCGLKKLLGARADVALVVTHDDRGDENIWFESVRECAARSGIPVVAPADPNSGDFVASLGTLQPDFLFSFYYRQMLSAAVLACASRGAYNLHGSLLPEFRGRAPVNWAVIEGATETGVTLHRMDTKPDHGPIVDQERVPILIDDTARQVFDKMTLAAGILLDRALPALFAGTAIETPQDLTRGHYYRARTPADGRIDWHLPAKRIHDLVRGTTRPYPGAYSQLGHSRLNVWRTSLLDITDLSEPDPSAAAPTGPRLFVHRGWVIASCGDGRKLRLLEFDIDGTPCDATQFARAFPRGAALVPRQPGEAREPPQTR